MLAQILRWVGKDNSVRKITSRQRNQIRSDRLQSLETLEHRSLLSTFGPELPQARIVNGRPTTDWPAVGLVGSASGGGVEYFCTGTLIAPQYVLSAAHCLEDVRGTNGRFGVGATEASAVAYRSSQIFVHPGWNGNIGDDSARDIAIMKLDQPVPGVTPISIFRGTPTVGQILTLVGFGIGSGEFGTKRIGTTPIDEVSSHIIAWNFDNNNESNTCNGDSGGPAFVQVGGSYYVAGVTSGGTGSNCGRGDYSFDTRVDAFASWVDSIVGTTPDPNPTPDPDPTPDPEPDPDPNPIDDDHSDDAGPDATGIELDDDGTGSAAGTLEVEGDRDVFQIDVAVAGTVTVSLASLDFDTYLRVVDEAGNLVAENDDIARGILDSEVVFSVQPGIYFISAAAYEDGEAGDYDVNVVVETDDHGDNAGQATAVSLDPMSRGQASGSIEQEGDHDFFSVVANRTGRMTIDLRGSGGHDPVLAVYDSAGRRIALNDDYGGTRNSRVQIRVRAGQTYFVDAYGYSNSTGRFDLLINGGTGRSTGRSRQYGESSPQTVVVVPDDRNHTPETSRSTASAVDAAISQLLRRG